MSSRAFGALVRREVYRGRTRLLVCLAVAAAGVAATVLVDGELALVPATISIFVGFFAMFGPLGDLRKDKALGYLEFDRVLPVSHRAIASARFVGAAVRTTPVALFAVPIVLAISSSDTIDLIRIGLAIAVGFTAWVMATAFIWLLMAVNIRWNLRSLWWVPMTIGFAPQIFLSVVPPEVKRSLARSMQSFGETVVAVASSRLGEVALLLILVATPLLLFLAAVSLFASGLERYTYSESTVELNRPPPTRELGAIGRGPMLAVARYCVRLATEQSRKRLILLAVFLVVLVVGPPPIQQYARFYVRALAAMIPGAIMIQLGAARARGDLEGLQQLPHPAVTTAAGHLLAVAALAVPGAVVWSIGRLVDGESTSVAAIISLLCYIAAFSWLAAVGSLWLNKWRTLWLGSGAALLVAAWVWLAGGGSLHAAIPALATQLKLIRTTIGVTLPIMISIAAMLVGLPLFARGLEEYQASAATRRNAERWAAAQRRRRQ
ncbi:MAG: hypothetical protein ACREK8_07995 [Gemmatimonadales bacterium]